MTTPAPVRLLRTEEHESFGGNRLASILGYVSTSPPPISALVDSLVDPDTSDAYAVTWLDATARTPVWLSDGTTVIHILWTVSGTRTEVLAGKDPWSDADLIGHEVHPGDTVTIPGEVPFAVGAGVIAVLCWSAPVNPAPDPAAWSGQLLPNPPTHGLNLFTRFNRRTICAATPALLLERWKISHPLDLPLVPGRWHYLANLVDPVAISWPGGSALLHRTESRLLTRGMDRITIVPDGLGYVLVASVPDLRRDVVMLLGRAGYDRSAIASLGVPIEFLE